MRMSPICLLITGCSVTKHLLYLVSLRRVCKHRTDGIVVDVIGIVINQVSSAIVGIESYCHDLCRVGRIHSEVESRQSIERSKLEYQTRVQILTNCRNDDELIGLDITDAIQRRRGSLDHDAAFSYSREELFKVPVLYATRTFEQPLRLFTGALHTPLI